MANHSFLVCSPSLAERGLSLLPVPPFVARLGFFLRLLLRASFGDVAWRRVASVQPASRQTTFYYFFSFPTFFGQWWLMAMICGDPETRHVE